MTRPQVFIDTWAWVAMAVDDEPNHQRAVVGMTEVRAKRSLLVTSNFVLAETLTRLRYDASLSIALRAAEEVEIMVATRRLVCVHVDDDLWNSAMDWFRRYTDQRFSFVDCTSFAIMHDRGINEALTGDQHFATAGFVPLGV